MEYKFTAENFEAEVMNSDIPVLVDFYADWCGPCKMMGPVVEELAEDYEGRAKVGKVNVDEQPALAEKFNVMSIPFFAVIKNGQVVDKGVGAMSADELEAKLDKALG
ncbi:MAG: thioredoxin [Lachnospiraceae bacterium]|nr:thioredoxin [Lachnospiraceae bacterium]